MKRKLIFSAMRNVKTVSLLTMILTLSATALFLLSLAIAAGAVEGAWGEAHTLTGKITAVDVSRPTKSLTLQSADLGLSAPDNEMNIFVNDKTVVQMCYAAKASPKDLKAGARTQVTYHEIAGLAVADFIYKPC
jgi:hypothetical protein